MKMIYDEVQEKYKYKFSVGELYEFGCSILRDCKSPFDDIFTLAVDLNVNELQNVASWAIGANHGSYESLDELKKDFLCWYGVNIALKSDDDIPDLPC